MEMDGNNASKRLRLEGGNTAEELAKLIFPATMVASNDTRAGWSG